MKLDSTVSLIEEHLSHVFEGKALEQVMDGIRVLLQANDARAKERPAIDSSRVFLITYGDSFFDSRVSGEPGLKTLKAFAERRLSDMVSDIHVLPMFPFTSDDGFSVTDYLTVRPDLGDWSDVSELERSFNVMFDFVANHMSKESAWFKAFLDGDPAFAHTFVEEDADFDCSKVTRPRTSPLFHAYNGKAGEKHVWTTFSEDQVDLNYRDPETFLRLTGVLMEYLARGASAIRLDAIGFMWKESGTTCMSLPQVHEVIKAWHVLVDAVAPHTQIITETNVPHVENISYFGNGDDEAMMVYQFALPPLVLHSFVAGDAEKLIAWARDIAAPSQKATYFNFLSSHDGIGLRPTEGILSDEERHRLVDRTLENGGRVSLKSNPDGSQSVYELNINYLAALRSSEDSDELWLAKVRAAFSILLMMVGVPAFYYHMLVGSGNDVEAVERTGMARRINRQQLDVADLEQELDTDPIRSGVYACAHDLVVTRRSQDALDPYGEQRVLDTGDSRVFAVLRRSGDAALRCYVNVSPCQAAPSIEPGIDVLTGEQIASGHVFKPFEVRWVRSA